MNDKILKLMEKCKGRIFLFLSVAGIGWYALTSIQSNVDKAFDKRDIVTSEDLYSIDFVTNDNLDELVVDIEVMINNILDERDFVEARNYALEKSGQFIDKLILIDINDKVAIKEYFDHTELNRTSVYNGGISLLSNEYDVVNTLENIYRLDLSDYIQAFRVYVNVNK